MARRISVEIVGDSRSLERSFQRSAHAAGIWNSEIVRASRGAFAATVGFGGLGRAVAFASGTFIGFASAATAIKGATGAFVDFNDTMQKSVGLAGVAQDQVAGLTDQVLKLAPAVGVGPQDLAKALYFITSSGIEASKSIDVLTKSAEASAAGLGDVMTTADAITTAINAYGAANMTAAHAADVLVSAVREGKGEADALAASIGPVAALAAELGVSFNDVGAALAAQTRLGIDAQTAAINLQQVFTNLLKVTPQSAKAFRSVGLSAENVRKELGEKGLLATLKTIQIAFGGNTKALANAFPNIRALRGLLALIGKQGGEVAGIFDRMSDASGSLQTAIDAVSRDARHRFDEMKAGVQAAGIALGAAFAPFAATVADAVTRASEHFLDFTKRVSEATGFHAKLTVIWEGIAGATTDLTNALKQAIAGVDWNAVWAEAGGIGDALQARLEQTDWGAVGDTIGKGIAAGVAGATTAAKELANRLTAALGAINWEELGKKIGPGLATAVLSAFTALTDPAFWARNWELMLAVAIAAFPVGRLGGLAARIGGLFVRAFGRIGAEIVVSIGLGIARFAPRLGKVFLGLFTGLGRLAEEGVLAIASRIESRFGSRIAGVFIEAFTGAGRLVRRLIGRLVDSVTNAFGRLGRVTRFAIRVTGVEFVIHQVSRVVDWIWDRVRKPFRIAFALSPLRFLINQVRNVFDVIKSIMTGRLQDAFNALKRMALQAALDIVEPFSHLPDWLGGGPFKRMKASIQGSLDEIDQASATTAQNVADNFTFAADAVQGAFAKIRPVPGATSPLAGQNRAAAFAPTPPTPDLPGPRRGGSDGTGKAAKGWQLPLYLQIAQAEAQLTTSVKDDVAVAKRIVAYVNSVRDKLSKQKLLDALGVLGSALDTIRGAAKDAADKAKEIADKMKQYDVPLTLQVAQARAEALGLPSERIATILRQIRASAQKAIKSGRLGLEGYRSAWDTIASVNDQLKNLAGETEDTFHKASTLMLTKGLGLTPEQRKALEQRLAQMGKGGTVPKAGYTGAFGYAVPVGAGAMFSVQTTVNLDGKAVARNTTRHQQRSARSNPRQKRGPTVGGGR